MDDTNTLLYNLIQFQPASWAKMPPFKRLIRFSFWQLCSLLYKIWEKIGVMVGGERHLETVPGLKNAKAPDIPEEMLALRQKSTKSDVVTIPDCSVKKFNLRGGRRKAVFDTSPK